MSQSYSNLGGNQSNRRYLILPNSSFVPSTWGGPIRFLVDGSNVAWWGSASNTGAWVSFDFGTPKIIDESKWIQDNSTGHGTWKWQGSNDNSSWTDIGGSFTLGGATTTTMTSLNGNTTAYRWYRLAGVSGSHSSSPNLAPIQFQIDDVAEGYFDPMGAGDRTASIIVTTSQASGHNDLFVGRFGSNDPTMNLFVDNLNRIDGSGPGALVWKTNVTAATSGRWLMFQFPSALIIDEIRYFQDTLDTNGVWQLQGSNDGSSFTNIGSTQTLGGSLEGQYGYSIFDFGGNTTAYLYYRFMGVSGNVSGNPFVFEMAFRVAASTSPPVALASPLGGASPLQGFVG